MRLIDARLCADCEEIYDEEQIKTCPVCTSPFFLKVSPLLGRMVDVQCDGAVLAYPRPTVTGIVRFGGTTGLYPVSLSGFSRDKENDLIPPIQGV